MFECNEIFTPQGGVKAGDIRDTGLIPGWGRSPGGGHGNPLRESPQTEESGGLQSMRSHRVGLN